MMAFGLEDTRKFLQELQHCPKKSLGQNFLIESQFVQKSITWANVQANDVVIEVGPGCGTLTQGLCQQGAHVYVVEKDNNLYKHIVERFPVDAKCGDALEYPVGNYDLTKPYKIVANLPYAIASIWLDAILTLPLRPQCMVLLVQKEAADRWLSEPNSKSFCPLGIFLQSAFYLEGKCCVPKRCFFPQPKVDSTLLCLKERSDGFIFTPSVKRFLRDIFTHRRQQLQRTCKEYASRELANCLLSALANSDFPPTVRAENLPLAFWQNYQRLVSAEVEKC